jgi:hypothetical protein
MVVAVVVARGGWRWGRSAAIYGGGRYRTLCGMGWSGLVGVHVAVSAGFCTHCIAAASMRWGLVGGEEWAVAACGSTAGVKNVLPAVCRRAAIGPWLPSRRPSIEAATCSDATARPVLPDAKRHGM